MVAGWFATGAGLCGLGVLLGAFGAHGLRDRLTPDMLAVFETRVRSHLTHARGLLAGNAKTKDLIATCPEDSPFAVQIFGNEPEMMAEAARFT